MSIKTVLLAGSGGNLGPSVLKALAESNFQLTVLTRKSSKSTVPEGIKSIKVSDDYPHDELVEALRGQDAVVSMVSPNQKALIDAAIEAGVKRFIPSDFGSDNGAAEAQRAVGEWKNKVAIRDYLKSKESSGLSWTAIANGPFFDWSFKVTRGHFFKIDIANKKALVLDDGNHPWSTSNLAFVGQSVVRVLEKPEETKNKFLFVESFTVTQAQILDGLEKELGFKFERETVNGKQWFNETAEKSVAGDVAAGFSAIMGWTILDGSFKDKPEFANEYLGLKEENFEESLTEAVKGFRS